MDNQKIAKSSASGEAEQQELLPPTEYCFFLN